MAFFDWFTPKDQLVDELGDMYTREGGPEVSDFCPEYWQGKPKSKVIGQLDFLPQFEGKSWCSECGWIDSPCSHSR